MLGVYDFEELYWYGFGALYFRLKAGYCEALGRILGWLCPLECGFGPFKPGCTHLQPDTERILAQVGHEGHDRAGGLIRGVLRGSQTEPGNALILIHMVGTGGPPNEGRGVCTGCGG